jgi:hypothetical protein
MPESPLNRRGFLKVLGSAVAAAGVSSRIRGEQPPSVAIVVDQADVVAAAAPASWAIEELTQALKSRGVQVSRVTKAEARGDEQLRILAAGSASIPAQRMLSDARVSLPAAPEALGIVEASRSGAQELLA